jgi:hypothetical protein
MHSTLRVSHTIVIPLVLTVLTLLLVGLTAPVVAAPFAQGDEAEMAAPAEPFLLIYHPLDGESVFTDTVTIAGATNPGNVVLVFTDEDEVYEAEIDEEGAFFVTVPLIPIGNDLVVLAFDPNNPVMAPLDLDLTLNYFPEGIPGGE